MSLTYELTSKEKSPKEIDYKRSVDKENWLKNQEK